MPLIKKIHIDCVRSGDSILCKDGKIRTLSPCYLKVDRFMGTTIWGDSYKLGTELVSIIEWRGNHGKSTLVS
jgi:hypothetical protein